MSQPVVLARPPVVASPPAPARHTAWWRNPFAWLAQWVARAYDKQIDATGLALYRIAYSLVLLLEIKDAYHFRHLRYDQIPYIIPNELDFKYAMIIWMGVVVCMILGLFTRVATIASWAFTLAMFSTHSKYEYHMFYAWTGLGLVLIFQNSAQVLSLDRLIAKLRYSTTSFRYEPSRTVTQLSYFVPVLLGGGFVYMGSILYKFTSWGWLTGIGMWRPGSLPFITYNTTAIWLMNNKFFAMGLGFMTVLFEFVFIFLYTTRRWRVPLMIVGAGLHLGIAWQFPIAWFGLGFVGLFLLMVPVAWWRWVFRPKPATAAPALTLYYDAECPLCARTRIALEHFDTRHVLRFASVQNSAGAEPALAGVSETQLLTTIHSVDAAGRVYQGYSTYLRALGAIWYLAPLSWLLRVPGLRQLGERLYAYVAANRTTERCTDETCGYAPPPAPRPDRDVKLLRNMSVRDVKVAFAYSALLLFSLIQIIISYHSAAGWNVRRRLNMTRTPFDNAIAHVTIELDHFAVKVFGLTNHAVFMDSHFLRHNHLIGVTYQHPDGHEEFVPITDERGFPDSYITGAQWVNWTFRVTGSDIDPTKLATGIRDYTAFWAHEHNLDLTTGGRFNIKVKKMDIPLEWQPDFLEGQLAHPWIDGGYVIWKDRAFTPYIKDIEKI